MLTLMLLHSGRVYTRKKGLFLHRVQNSVADVLPVIHIC